eukprot:scaffold77056_cov57-Phaeocystis_antarctica.AAC.2
MYGTPEATYRPWYVRSAWSKLPCASGTNGAAAAWRACQHAAWCHTVHGVHGVVERAWCAWSVHGACQHGAARPWPRLPQASASLGQSAAWSVLAGHRPCFRHGAMHAPRLRDGLRRLRVTLDHQRALVLARLHVRLVADAPTLGVGQSVSRATCYRSHRARGPTSSEGLRGCVGT